MIKAQFAAIEENLQKTVNKRFDELAKQLSQQTERAVTNNCNRMATDMRLRIQKVKNAGRGSAAGNGISAQKPKPDTLKEQVEEAKRRFQEQQQYYRTVSNNQRAIGTGFKPL